VLDTRQRDRRQYTQWTQSASVHAMYTMGYAQRDNGPCDSRHSRAYCPVPHPAPARLLPGFCSAPARLLLESCPQRGALCPDGPRSPTAWTPYSLQGAFNVGRSSTVTQRWTPPPAGVPSRHRSRPYCRGAPPAEGIVRHCLLCVPCVPCVLLSLSATGAQVRRARQTGSGAVRVGVEPQPRCRARQTGNGMRHDVGRSARAGL